MSHPDRDWLDGYAAGSLPPPLALCVGVHLAGCADCRRQTGALQRLAAALFAALPPAAVEPDLRARVLASAARPPAPAPPPGAAADAEVPAPLRRWVPGGYRRLRWSRALPGLWHFGLPGGDGYRAALLRVAAGGSVPDHDHRGIEATVVLQGGYADHFGHYGAGDFVVRRPGESHRPRAAAGGDCICLVVQAGPVRFTGGLWRLVNPLLR